MQFKYVIMKVIWGKLLLSGNIRFIAYLTITPPITFCLYRFFSVYNQYFIKFQSVVVRLKCLIVSACCPVLDSRLFLYNHKLNRKVSTEQLELK